VNIVERVKNIIMTPKTEWDVIAGEATQPKDLVITYVLPLAALAAIAGFIGTVVIGSFFLGHLSFVWGLVALVVAPHHVGGVGVRDRLRDRRARAQLRRPEELQPGDQGGGVLLHAGLHRGLFAIIPILGGFVGCSSRSTACTSCTWACPSS
jgi:hypothetical protein